MEQATQSVLPFREVEKLLSFGWQVVSSSESLSCGHGEAFVKADRSMMPVSVARNHRQAWLLSRAFLCAQKPGKAVPEASDSYSWSQGIESPHILTGSSFSRILNIDGDYVAAGSSAPWISNSTLNSTQWVF